MYLGEGVWVYSRIKQEKKIINKYGQNKSTMEAYTFKWPYLLAKGPNGELFVGNNHEDAKHLVVFDKKLEYSKVIGNKDTESEKIGVICGIAVNNQILYVSDGELNCIWKFNPDSGKFLKRLGKRGENHGEFKQPAGLLLTRSHLLFVCDRQNHRIQVFQNDDTYFYKFGRLGYYPTPGTLREPVDLTMNNDQEKVFVTCWRSNTVQVFTTNGKFLTEITTFSVTPFYCDRPNGIFCTPDDYLLVASRNHVLIFKLILFETDVTCTFVSAIEGEYNNKRRFKDCIGVIMMDDGKIVIADGHYGTNRLIVF